MTNTTFSRYRDRAIIATVLIFGLTLSIFEFFAVQKIKLETYEREHFARDAADAALSVEFQFNGIENVLTAVLSLFDSSQYVDADEFDLFAKAITDRTSTVRAAGWAPIASGEPAQEARAFTLDYAFAHTGAAEAEELKRLWRATNAEELARLASDPAFDSLRVLDTGALGAASGAILAAIPVRDHGARDRTEQASRPLLGVVIGLAYSPELKLKALSRINAAADLDVSITRDDASSRFDETLAPFQYAYHFRFANNDWHVFITPTHQVKLSAAEAWLAALATLTVFGVLSWFVGYQIYRRRVVERIVQSRTHDLKSERDRFELAMISTADGFLDWEIQKETITYSEQFLDLLGYAQDAFEDNLYGLIECIHPDDRNQTLHALNRHLREKEPFELRLRMRLISGEYQWFCATGQALWNAQDVAERMAISISNINDLVESQKRAEEANHAKSQFLANTSHEIRTPLNGVLGMAQLLMNTDLDEKQREFAETIMSSGTALLSLINNVLDLSKIEAGLFELDEEPFEITALVQSAIDTVAGVAAQKNINLSSDIDASLSGRYLGDINRLRQVLTNLAGNAVKFTDDGGVKISVRQFEDDRVRFSVSDTGSGLSQDQCAVIFDRFSQTDNSSTRKHSGTGLGLAISRDIVQLAGGELCVDSTPGRGSTFWFEIPLRRTAAKATSDSVAPEAPDQDDGDFSPCNILVAEDNLVNRMVLKAALEPQGYLVTMAENGEQALEQLKKNHFDLVLMDIQMPVMSGDVALRHIRQSKEAYKDVPVIVLTANAMKGAREEYLNAGANGYIVKPVNIDYLLKTIATYRWNHGARHKGIA